MTSFVMFIIASKVNINEHYHQNIMGSVLLLIIILDKNSGGHIVRKPASRERQNETEQSINYVFYHLLANELIKVLESHMTE